MDKTKNLKSRVGRLAREKSYFQLMANLMNQLSTVSGLGNTIEKILQIVKENIGGTNVCIYYCIEGKCQYSDVFGESQELSDIDDPDVKKVFENGAPIEISRDLSNSGTILQETINTSTWLLPLKVHNKTIGVFKITDIIISAAEIQDYLNLFLNYAALILKNEINNYAKLNNTNDLLKISEQNYMRLSKELEAIMDHIPGAVFYKDAKNNFIRVNKYMADAHHKPKQELEGMNLSALFTPDVAEEYLKDDLEVIKSGKPKLDIEEPWETPEGLRWVNTSKIPFVDERGVIKGIIGVSTDITERKLAEEALNSSELRFKKLIEAIPLPIGISDNQGKIIFRNHRFIKVFGYTENDVATLDDWWEKAYPDPQYRKWAIDNWESKISNALKQGSDIESDEYMVTCKDGSRRIIIITGTIIFDNFLVTFIDITDRKQAEEALINSEEILNEAGRLAKLGGWEIQLQKNKLTWTEETYRIHEVDPSVQPKLEDGINFYPPEAQKLLIPALERTMTEGVPFDMELPFITAKGRHIWVRSIGHAAINDGKPVRVYGIFQDITERKRSEELLRENEARLKDVIECNFDGMIVVDQDGFIRMSNPAAAALLNSTPEKIIGIPFGLPITADESSEIIILRSDGGLSTVEMRFSNILWMANNAYIVSLRDVTQRKKIEEEIKQKNIELSKLNAEKDKFFSIIAHDLKSPFNSIQGFSQLLIEMVKVQDYDEVGKYSGIILESSERAMELLLNLMEWSLSQTGRMEFNPEYIEMVNLIDDTALLSGDPALQKSITITKKLPHRLLAYADKNMIKTILRNLISNAIKFSKHGGEIVISTIEEQNEIMVSVSDNGVGISKSNMDKLFRIDENFSTYGTNNEKGTGLGLILCKEFIEKHGGRIWVESELGQGSTFKFTIPDKKRK